MQQQSKKKIDRKFVDVYDSLINQLKKDNRLHYLKVKKIGKGIKIGDIRIQKNKYGYILKKGFHRGFSIIEKDIAIKKSAIMLAIFYNQENMMHYKEVLELDEKYSSAIAKLHIAKGRMRYYANENDWFKVHIFEDRLKNWLWKAESAQHTLNTMYFNHVF
jgi:hypothetical protein